MQKTITIEKIRQKIIEALIILAVGIATFFLTNVITHAVEQASDYRTRDDYIYNNGNVTPVLSKGSLIYGTNVQFVAEDINKLAQYNNEIWADYESLLVNTHTLFTDLGKDW